MANQRPILVLVGGYLGAGKTSLILRAGAMLRDRGMRVAVITNDQDSGLVDTRLAEAQQVPSREVAGGCFCCQFSDLLESAAQLAAYAPDVIFAEPVGSCIDISATTLQPLKAYHAHEYRVAPFTVLVDPELADQVYRGHADQDVSYLFRNQLAEADLLCVTKADLRDAPANLPVPVDLALSSMTGQGIAEWLDEVLHSRRVAGARVLDVDYTRYAEAEAALGWLNLHAEVRLRNALAPSTLVGPLLEDLDNRLTQAAILIAHLKVFDQAPSGYIKASICANGDTPAPEGDLAASPDEQHELMVNLRALGDPERLQKIVEDALSQIEGAVEIGHVRAFRPPPPKPEHRFNAAWQDSR